ncbi:MAG: potassium transporter Kup [Legionellaceae bacterium]|nr:potassium transporter Kup [Legionellaceae bacterium]HCA88862.1 potassium transporter Kup [Legionellales bacterium]|tara:strand:+ start:97 stop:1962 length:1866 start_codon:yes stop_codon:yes gene_type:complete
MTHKTSLKLIVGALGVVYGDIGTSPLYAMRETLTGLTITTPNILGVLSLIIWSLIIVISLKYLWVVFRADNEGEGGILALLSLLNQSPRHSKKLFYFLAIFGAGLLVGDGMLTPAISVSSAIEGLEMVYPHFQTWSPILSAIVLMGIFGYQYKGIDKIGKAFGFIIGCWFITIGILGLIHIMRCPLVLKAFNPYYAWYFFKQNGVHGFFLLGGIFLVVTGGEALYADIGSFGKQAIRYSWFLMAFPCLVLNYLGQGANLIINPRDIDNPFYNLAADWFFWPLIILATLATIIASQAVISATFSLTKQAVLLGLCPKFPIKQTSEEHAGQIYIGQINIMLFIGTLLLIYTFQNASNLAHAYGIAVNLDMIMVSMMVFYASRRLWQWSLFWSLPLFGLFFAVDLAFLSANSYKFLTGGWVPVSFAIMIAMIMHNWHAGLTYLKTHRQQQSLSAVIQQLHQKKFNKLPYLTAIFLTDIYDTSGVSFLNFLKLNRAIPETILILNYKIANKPYIPPAEQFELQKIDHNIINITLHFGFMDNIFIPKILRNLNEKQLLPAEIDIDNVTFFVEIPHIIASRQQKTLSFYWQERFFAFLMRNYSANLNIEFYKLPHNRTIALGNYIKI